MPTRAMNKGVDEMIYKDEMLKKVAFKDVRGELEKGLVKNSIFNNNNSCSESEESSSIGKNSDLSENSLEKSKSGDCEEVQSSYKGPLDAMEALEEVLPISRVDVPLPFKHEAFVRRGISRFYNGKSKSFASLADTSSSSSSIKDLSKPDNAYIRKRRNLLACNLVWDKTRSSPLRGNVGGGISKRVTGSGRTTLALAVAMNNCESEKQQGGECNSNSAVASFSSWRSFSLADLQHCVSVSTTCSNLSRLAKKPS
ncbi:hypothetical protein BUALT_Bualt10G0134500 [Buddleja alternifolia]|uniref:Uncharacterized protein n=1 Tax=Buddleja alternifolia TaxID=168488 RepID=A0AAV6X730_9LAMI|nr:hypothetical protein BUALT_Bualt10G0134500 [Buddleja alternifolia]